MSEEILNNLQETVNGHTKRLDKIDVTLTEHTAILNEHTERLDKIEEHLDRIDVVLVEHTERFDRIEEKMATKDDIARITTTLDTLVGLYSKTDQETTFMGERVTRVEEDVAKIKPLVGLT